MSGRRRVRDERRRRLGQNFLRPRLAEAIVAEAGVTAGDLVVDIGAGKGALSIAAARLGAQVISLEFDDAWVEHLRRIARSDSRLDLSVVEGDFLDWPLPGRPFRVVGSLPFASTTAIMHRLFDRPDVPVVRADLIVQWEVARKRAATPSTTLVSTSWAPWWEFTLGRFIPASEFRPVPRVDAGVLIVKRRDPPLLPLPMATSYRRFLRNEWPFESH